jgi:hypothetical protein
MTSGHASTPQQLPLSVKAVIGLLGIMFLMIIGMQGVSFINFELARSLGFQENDHNSSDPFNRGRALLEQGTAGTDVLIQGLLLIEAISDSFGVGLLGMHVRWVN